MNLLRAIKETWSEFGNPTTRRKMRTHYRSNVKQRRINTIPNQKIQKKTQPDSKIVSKGHNVQTPRHIRERVVKMIEPPIEKEYDQEKSLEPFINRALPQDPSERFRMDLKTEKKPQFSLLPELHPDLKQVRWLHLNDLGLLKAITLVKAGGIPPWAKHFTGGTLTVKNGILYWNNLPFLFKRERISPNSLKNTPYYKNTPPLIDCQNLLRGGVYSYLHILIEFDERQRVLP
jgi:hypothetical protein